MPLKMVEPTKHSRSGVYRVRLTVPENLREAAFRLYGVRREFTENLGTKDKREALALAPAALGTIQAKLEAIRAAHEGKGRTLSNRQVRAVVGEWYKAEVRAYEDNPGSAEDWSAFHLQHTSEADPEDGTYEPDDAALIEANGLLSRQNIVADEASIKAVAVALWGMKAQVADLMVRRARGDYSPDPIMETIPSLPASPRGATVPIDSIVKGWARDQGYDPDAKPIPRNYYDRHRTATRLGTFLTHTDAARVTKADAVAWKQSMAGKSLATVANDISEMSAVWKWAIANGKLNDNPFAGILPPKKSRNKKATRRPYTDAEAVTILEAARHETGAHKWLPWVLALTGARLTEICQGVKEDLVMIEGTPFLRIHRDDDERAEGETVRSVKNEASIRTIPIHPRLVKEGFAAYVAALPAGSPLFPDILPDKQFGNRGTTAQKVLSKWLRGKLKISDKRISPAHSWRHYWIDAARRVGMHPEVRDAITGHTDDRNESHSYGLGLREMPARLIEEMEKISLPDALKGVL
jgi:integrase